MTKAAYVIEGVFDEWEETPDAPAPLLALANAKKHERLPASDAPADLPGNNIRAIVYLKNAPVAVDGSGKGNTQTFEVAASLWDLGISEGKAVELMLEYYNPRCLGPWPDEDIIQIVHNAYSYPQNGFGCRAVLPWDQLLPADVRDKLIAENIASKEAAQTEEKDRYSVIAELNRQYAVTSMGGKTFVMRFGHDSVLGRRRLDYSTKANFYDALANRFITDPNDPDERIALAPYWFKHSDRRQYLGGVALAPLKDVPMDVFNLWQGFSVEPKNGDCSLFKEHIFKNLCSGNQELFDYLMNWLARMIQQPGSPGEVAIALRGKKGVGKGIVGKFIGKLLNDHFIHAVQADHVTGKFNGHLGDCVFLFADEAFFAGNPAHEKILNGLITETTRLSEDKFLRAVMVPNYIHLLISTNSEWAVPATTDERRYFVLDVGDAHMQDTEYFGAIDREMKAGGLSALLYELQNRDISKFEVRRVPATEALTNQKRLTRAGRSGTIGWLEDILTAGEIGKLGQRSEPIRWEEDWEGPEIGCNAAYDLYVEWQIKQRRGNTDDRRLFGRKLFEALGEAVEKFRAPGDHTGHRAWMYRFASLDECRRAFMRTQNSPGLWGADDD